MIEMSGCLLLLVISLWLMNDACSWWTSPVHCQSCPIHRLVHINVWIFKSDIDVHSNTEFEYWLIRPVMSYYSFSCGLHHTPLCIYGFPRIQCTLSCWFWSLYTTLLILWQSHECLQHHSTTVITCC
jgi:hypothetical protein